MIVAIGVVLLLAGVACLTFARRKYMDSRTIARLKDMALRDLGPGLVRITGKGMEAPLVSPVMGAPCYSYKVLAEELTGTKDSSPQWSGLSRAEERRSFSFSDGTGEVLVDPSGADLEIPTTFFAELHPKEGFLKYDVDANAALEPPSERVIRYMLRANLTRPRAELLAAAEAESRSEPQGLVEKLTQKAVAAAAGAAAKKVVKEVTGLTVAGNALRYRLTETCLLPNRQYSIVGTCERAAEGFPWVIKAGTAKAPFVIADGPPGKIAGKVRKTALLLLAAGLFAIGFGVLMIAAPDKWVTSS